MELILLRHSEAEGNARHVFLGRTDSPLTVAGVELAKTRSPELPRVERVYTSPLLRARTTARLIWPGIITENVPGIREMDFGVFDGRTNDELMQDEFYRQWLAQNDWTGYPGGETFAAARSRCAAAFCRIVREAHERGLSRVGVVAHGGSIMLIMEQFTDVRVDFVENLVKNCGGFRMEVVRRGTQAVVTECERI